MVTVGSAVALGGPIFPFAPPPHVPVGPVPIFDGTPQEALDFCLHAARSGIGARIATANLDFLAQARTNSTLLDDLQGSSLIVADGAPVVALARLAGALEVERTAGVDLAIELCRAGGIDEEFRIVLYGGEPEACLEAAKRLEALAPHTRVVLTHSPPFRALSADEQDEERALIAAADPHLVLVGLGCPKQEHRIREYYGAAPGAVWIGVGGAFEMIAGHRRRAGRMVQQLGLEWLVRMAQDPGRLARRYLGRDMPALPLIALDVVMQRFTRTQVSAVRGDH